MELLDKIRSYGRRMKQEKKQEINMCFLLADIIAGRVFAEKKEDIPQPWDYYPELFKEEKNIFEEEKEKQRFEEYKEQRRKYVEEFNRRRH